MNKDQLRNLQRDLAAASVPELADTPVIEGEIDFARLGRARAGQRNHGLMRLYAEPETGKLLGAEMCAPAAEHMAHFLALALDRGMTVRELAAQLPPASDSDLPNRGGFEALGAEVRE